MDDLDDLKERVDQMVAGLKSQYEKLRLKAGLAKLEAIDEWHDVDAKLKKLEAKAKELGGVTAEASKDVGAAARLLGEEIRDGFRNVAKHL